MYSVVPGTEERVTEQNSDRVRYIGPPIVKAMGASPNEQSTHGLINFAGTKVKCHHLKNGLSWDFAADIYQSVTSS